MLCEQCPNPKHTGRAATGKHRHSSSSSEICKHKTLTKARLHGRVSQAPGVWPGSSLHKKPKPDLGRPSGRTSGKQGMNHHGFVLVCKEPCWTAGPCDGTSRLPAGKAVGEAVTIMFLSQVFQSGLWPMKRVYTIVSVLGGEVCGIPRLPRCLGQRRSWDLVGPLG